MTATHPNRDSVALRAYFIWEGEGRPHGCHEHHWFSAEAIEALSTAETRASDPMTAAAAPAKTATSAKTPAAKTPAAKKPAAAKKAAQAKGTAPKAPAEAVVAAAALAAPRAARTATKGARRTH